MKRDRRYFRQQAATRGILAIAADALDIEFDTPDEPVTEQCSDVAVVNIRGPLEHHACWFWDSYDDIAERVQEAFASDCKAVVLRIDSPGGDAAGCFELHKSLRAMRNAAGKPLLAFVDETAASAAYSIACACDTITLPPSGRVGSIGVIGTLCDRVKQNERVGINVVLVTTGTHKSDGHPDKPIDDGAVAEMQRSVDALGKLFFETVATSRKMSVDDVKALQARVLAGSRAVKAGLADGVASWDAFLSSIGDTSHEDATTKGQNAMKTLAQLKAALLAATTDNERKAALEALEAKYKKTVKKSEETEEDDGEGSDEEEGEGETDAEDEADEEEESDEELPPKDDDEDDESDDEDEDAEDEEDGKKSKKSKARVESLIRAVAKLTGKRNPREQLGALEAMSSRIANATRNDKRLQVLENNARREKVTAMLKAARREGRITAKQIDPLRAQGMKDAKWLKGYLATLPKIVRTDDDATIPEQHGAPNAKGLTPDMIKMATMSARADGVPVDKRIAEIAERMASNTSTPKY